MSKHTPGPWHWDSDPIKNDPLNRVRYRVVTTGKTITQCYYSSSDEQAEWDARLIAAAPEMLDALNAAEDLLHRMGMQSSDAYQEIDAAIAKATGEKA